MSPFLTLASLPVLFATGFATWWLCVRRMRAILDRQPNFCGAIVVIEELAALLVFAYILKTLDSGQWLPAVLYALGGGTGARWAAARR